MDLGARGLSFIVMERPAIHSYGYPRTINHSRTEPQHYGTKNYSTWLAIPFLSGLFCLVATPIGRFFYLAFSSMNLLALKYKIYSLTLLSC